VSKINNERKNVGAMFLILYFVISVLYPPENFFLPPGNMCWAQFKTIGYRLKNLDPSQKTLRHPWCPELVAGLTFLQIKCGWLANGTEKKLFSYGRTCNSKETVPEIDVSVLNFCSL